MSDIIAELHRLADLKRSRANFEKIQEQVSELRGYADAADELLTAAAEARNALNDLLFLIPGEDDGNPLAVWS